MEMQISFFNRTWQLYTVSNATSTWFKDQCYPVLDWPANSVDLNRVEMRQTAELEDTLRASWAVITPEQCTRLIDSMPSHLAAVIQTKGVLTKY